MIYKRDLQGKKLGLGLLFFAEASILVYSAKSGLSNLGWAVVVCLICTGFIKLTGLNIYSNKTELEHFYFFGLIPVKQVFQTEIANMKLTKKLIDIAIPDSETVLDLLYSFFHWKGHLYQLEINVERKNGDPKKVLIQLTKKEYETIGNFLKMH
jgi:hypothetical protein